MFVSIKYQILIRLIVLLQLLSIWSWNYKNIRPHNRAKHIETIEHGSLVNQGEECKKCVLH